MKQKVAFSIVLSFLFIAQTFAQLDSTLYGIARHSNGQLYLAKANFSTGQITNISPDAISSGIVMGALATIDTYNNIFYLRSSGLMGVDLASGNVLTNPPLTTPFQLPYFDLMQFNCKDSTIYGVTRNANGQLFLAKVNVSTGQVTNISSAPFSSGIVLNGLATLDPYKNIFYLQSNGKLIGIDMTSGIVVTAPRLTTPFQLPYFDLMQFNCKDSTIYGLTRNATGQLYLAKANASTGVVTNISSVAFSSGYGWGSLATIDPLQNIYYLQSNSRILGLDLTSGSIIASLSLATIMPGYFDLMRFRSNVCNNIPKSISAYNGAINVFPNPSSHSFTINFENQKKEECSLFVYSAFGQLAFSIEKITSEEVKIERGNLASGLYIIQLRKDNKVVSTGRILIEE